MCLNRIGTVMTLSSPVAVGMHLAVACKLTYKTRISKYYYFFLSGPRNCFVCVVM
jgi:hypothetical protein